MLSWNKLPSDVKNSQSLDIFKSNLELYKNKTRALGISGTGNYWEISRIKQKFTNKTKIYLISIKAFQ